jgi:DNA polymerase III alpha subunit
MAAFAGYGFPKAHAASYALVAWRSAWCKQHYPTLFMAAVLANWGGYYSQRVYITEARRMGLELRAPHINHALREFSVQFSENEPVLFMGLNQVRELTQRTQKRIIRSRPFNSLQDFLTRVDPRPTEVENLIKISALEGFGSIPGLLEQVKHSGWQGGQLPLFTTSIENAEDWSIGEKAAAQKNLIGVSLIAHPLELSAQTITDQGAVTTQQATEHLGQRLRVAGMRQTWRRSRTSDGDYIYFMGLEDLEGMLRVIISAEVYRRCRPTIKGSGPYIIEGVLEMDDRQSEPVLHAERVWSITPKVDAV